MVQEKKQSFAQVRTKDERGASGKKHNIRAKTATYGGVVLIFERYKDSLQNLKKQTWEVCHRNRVQYNLSENTIIKNLKLKYINSNIPGWTDARHDHQEADTLLLCVINKLGQLLELGTAGPLLFRLISPYTDVFMLAIHLVSLLPRIKTLFKQLASKVR